VVNGKEKPVKVKLLIIYNITAYAPPIELPQSQP